MHSEHARERASGVPEDYLLAAKTSERVEGLWEDAASLSWRYATEMTLARGSTSPSAERCCVPGTDTRPPAASAGFLAACGGAPLRRAMALAMASRCGAGVSEPSRASATRPGSREASAPGSAARSAARATISSASRGRAEPAGAERGERPVGLAGAEPGIELGDERRIAPEVGLPIAGERPQTDGAGERERVRLGLVGQDGIRGPAREQLGERAVVVRPHQQRVREEARGDPLEVPARVHPESEPGGARVEPLVGEHDRPRLRDRACEYARHSPLRPGRDAAHREVEAPRREVPRQLRPAEADELEAAAAVAREAACDLDVEPLERAVAREREGRIVAARADTERRQRGRRVEARRGEDGQRRRAPHSPSTSRIE